MRTAIKNFLFPKRPTDVLPHPHVDLYYWRPKNGTLNFGDHLSKIIVNLILSTKGFTLDDETPQNKRLFALGSILQFTTDGSVVWGSGWNGKAPAESFTTKRLDIRAVRGPLTADFLTKRGFDVPPVFGDPALLLPLVCQGRFKPNPIREFAIVPNLHDIHLPALLCHRNDIISPLLGWNTVVTQILEAKLILASSLHGLIIAEAFGIPARYVRFSETESLFKYEDYYQGTGRMTVDYVTSIDEGMEMGGAPPISPSYSPLPLLNAFPWDVWTL